MCPVFVPVAILIEYCTKSQSCPARKGSYLAIADQIRRLKDEQHELGAEFAVIVTAAMPKDRAGNAA